MLILPSPPWGQPTVKLYTCRGSERARDWPTVTQQATGSAGIKAHST